MKRQSQNKIY